jgi:hypothetical protein
MDTNRLISVVFVLPVLHEANLVRIWDKSSIDRHSGNMREADEAVMNKKLNQDWNWCKKKYSESIIAKNKQYQFIQQYLVDLPITNNVDALEATCK